MLFKIYFWCCLKQFGGRAAWALARVHLWILFFGGEGGGFRIAEAKCFLSDALWASWIFPPLWYLNQGFCICFKVFFPLKSTRTPCQLCDLNTRESTKNTGESFWRESSAAIVLNLFRVCVTDDQSAATRFQQLGLFSTRAIFIRGVVNHFEETEL